MAAGNKNARRRRAWLVFEDESGLSHHPVVRRTWAPRGRPPILTHVRGNWKRLSIAAAMAFRWDGQRSRVYFQTRPGTYTDERLVPFLRALKHHFRRRPVILLWDGLAAHKSRRMRAYLARPRPWLQVERLPASSACGAERVAWISRYSTRVISALRVLCAERVRSERHRTDHDALGRVHTERCAMIAVASLLDTEGEPSYRDVRPGEGDGNENHPGDASWKGSARCPPSGRRGC